MSTKKMTIAIGLHLVLAACVEPDRELATGESALQAAQDGVPPQQPAVPRVADCAEAAIWDVTTVTQGWSYDHHVRRSREHADCVWFGNDILDTCHRNWCLNNDPVGSFFTYHGAKVQFTWEVKCVRTRDPSNPCVAEVQNWNNRTLEDWDDNTGQGGHWHAIGSPGFTQTPSNGCAVWDFGCSYTGTLPNIHWANYCTTREAKSINGQGDHVAYAMGFDTNHTSHQPVGLSVGVIAGPAFGAVSFNPTPGGGAFNSTMNWETQFECTVDRSEARSGQQVDIYKPVVRRTRQGAVGGSGENATFAAPSITLRRR